MPGMLVGISIPYLHFSASSSRSKHPVPAGASWPSMMFSDTPFIGSHSPWEDASISTSTWRRRKDEYRWSLLYRGGYVLKPPLAINKILKVESF